MSSSSISQSVLYGHKDPVVSLYVSADGTELLSSAEDFTMRLWDIREKNSAIRMFKVGRYHGDIGFCRRKDNLCTVSAGNCLFAYDLRVARTVIVTEPLMTFSVPGSDNEINDYDFGYNTNFLVVPADCGSIHVVSGDTFRPLSVVDNAHENIASVARFLPNDNNVVSGGYDCFVSGWKIYDKSVHSTREAADMRLDKRIAMSSLIPSEDGSLGPEASRQTVNPPFVTSLNVFNGVPSSTVCVGSGDGSVLVYGCKRGKPDFRQILWGGSQVHGTAATATCWSGDGSSLWSVGNDGVLINMTETRIQVRLKMEGKGTAVTEIGPSRVAVASGSKDIVVYDFR